MRDIWCAPSCLLLLLSCAASLEEPGAPAGGCPPCVPDECPPLPAWGCPLGKVRDNCGCCWRCARGEGEACGSGVSGGVAVVWGRCATGLECRRRAKSRGATGVCVCKSRYPVCGSDGLTYPSTCQLRAGSLRAKSRGERPVEQRSKGPCEQGRQRRKRVAAARQGLKVGRGKVVFRVSARESTKWGCRLDAGPLAFAWM